MLENYSQLLMKTVFSNTTQKFLTKKDNKSSLLITILKMSVRKHLLSELLKNLLNVQKIIPIPRKTLRIQSEAIALNTACFWEMKRSEFAKNSIYQLLISAKLLSIMRIKLKI